MQHKRSKASALAIAVVTPNLLTNAMASDRIAANAVPSQVETGVPHDAGRDRVAQNTRTMSKEEARKQVRAELALMTPREKARLGRSQVDIEDLAVETVALSTCCFTPTNGVTCTDPATGGFACCIITLAPPSN